MSNKKLTKGNEGKIWDKVCKRIYNDLFYFCGKDAKKTKGLINKMGADHKKVSKFPKTNSQNSFLADAFSGIITPQQLDNEDFQKRLADAYLSIIHLTEAIINNMEV